MSEVLEEAWEMVDHGWIDEADFRDFVFANPVRFFTGANPRVLRRHRRRGDGRPPYLAGAEEARRCSISWSAGGTVVDGTGAPGASGRRRRRATA